MFFPQQFGIITPLKSIVKSAEIFTKRHRVVNFNAFLQKKINQKARNFTGLSNFFFALQ